MLRRFCRWCSDDGIRSAASRSGPTAENSAGETFESVVKASPSFEGSPAATRQIALERTSDSASYPVPDG